jgi:2-succinyl-6-hydroxy-2,4-cyclohexadiene-1-carboxylate synthase
VSPAAAGPQVALREGKGPRIVLLPGFLGAPSLWDAALAAAAPGAALASVTLPGHGAHPWIPFPSGTSHADGPFALVVERLARALPPGPGAVLAGYSMGARLALSLLSLEPGRHAGALLVGVDPGLADPAERAARQAWDEAQAAAIEREGLPAFVERWAELPLFASQRALPQPTLDAQRQARLAHSAGGAAWAMRSLGLGAMPERWSTLPAIRCPITVLTGELDQKFTDLGRRMAAASPRVRHVVAEGAGHNVVLERPAAVAAALRALLSPLLPELPPDPPGPAALCPQGNIR